MPKIELEFEESEHSKIMGYKKIYENITDDKISLEDFVRFLISRGMDTMVWDIIPQDPEILKNTIDSIKEQYPDFFTEFVLKTLERGKVKEEAKKKVIPYG